MVWRGVAATLGLASLLLLTALAGCASKASGGGDLKLANGQTIDLAAAASQATGAADRGIISGVVVDAAIRPIASANLTLVGQGIATHADATGIFVIPNLKPGLYTVQARANGFQPIQSTAEVKAGETAKVRMVMDVDRSPIPFHSATAKFKGFYNVGSGLVDEVQTLEGNKTVGPVTTPYAATCTCVWPVDFEANASTYVIEAQWTPTVAKPGLPSPADLGPTEMTYNFEPNHGPSPPLIFCYGTPCAFHEWGTNVSRAATHATIHFWSDDSWVTFNQDFTAFFTVFYNGQAPADWAFTKGST
jgi:hypothetical protein